MIGRSNNAPTAKVASRKHNITCTKDVGEIVFHLIAEGIFSKSEDDRIEDFENVYDFHTAFVAPFLPGGFTPMSASS